MTVEELKHLDYIQSTISRMASNQFYVKGWMVTVNTAILTVFANSFNKNEPIYTYLLVPLFPTILFWYLNAKYLQFERKLRALYRDVVKKSNQIEPFEMEFSHYKGKKCSFISCLLSPTNFFLYFPICFVFVFAYFYCLYIV